MEATITALIEEAFRAHNAFHSDAMAAACLAGAPPPVLARKASKADCPLSPATLMSLARKRPAPEVPEASPATALRAEMRKDHLQFIKKNRPENTTRAYDSGVRGYQKFIEGKGLGDLIDTPEAVAACMRDRLEKKQAESTISGLLSAISDSYRYKPNNPTKDPLIEEMSRVVRRRTAPPVETEELPKALFLRILDAMDTAVSQMLAADKILDAFRVLRDRLAFLILYATFQRPKSVVDLQRDDVTMGGPPAYTQLKFIGHVDDGTFGPKNLQGGKHCVTVARHPESQLDLTQWAEAYTLTEALLLKPSDKLPKWLIYNTTGRDFGKQLSPRTLNSRFKTWLEIVEPTAKYTVYCIKVGAVSTARRGGMDEAQRRAHGGWRSAAGEGYNRYSHEERLDMSKLI